MPSIENIFYFIGLCFAVISVVYFSKEYLLEFPKFLKATLLVILTITFFQVANYMKVRQI